MPFVPDGLEAPLLLGEPYPPLPGLLVEGLLPW